MKKIILFTLWCCLLLSCDLGITENKSSSDIESLLLKTSFVDLNENNLDLSVYKKDKIVVSYWATWCAPCIKEIPELNEFAKENDDLLVFTFNFDFLEVDDLEPIAERFNIEVPSLITHPNEIWGIDTPPAVPATFFINPAGEVVLSLFRPQTKEELNRIFIELKNAI